MTKKRTATRSVESRVCMICGKPSEGSICEPCKSNVQGEVAHRKQEMEKQVRIGSEIEKNKAVKEKRKGSK